MKYNLTRPDGTDCAVDSDLWIAFLEIAATNGWVPLGTAAGAASPKPFDPLEYGDAVYQEVAAEDAQALAAGARRGLRHVPGVELPLSDRPFGGSRTLELLRQAAAGNVPREDHAEAAVEVLSGPPRAEALALVEFLDRGAFTLAPGS